MKTIAHLPYTGERRKFDTSETLPLGWKWGEYKEPEPITDPALKEAKALGFSSVEDMERHARWLEETGGPAYKEWLASIKRLSN